jgi:AbrB family looped-hinge helix DNA binding protein
VSGFTVKVDASGRILLPAKVRRQFKLTEGSTMVGSADSEQLVLKTRARALKEVQAYFSQFRKPGRKLLSEELIQERRREARRELEG